MFLADKFSKTFVSKCLSPQDFYVKQINYLHNYDKNKKKSITNGQTFIQVSFFQLTETSFNFQDNTIKTFRDFTKKRLFKIY